MIKNTSLLLENEENDRIEHLLQKGEVDLIDFFKYDKIKNAFNEDYLIIQGSFKNNYNVISSLPLYSYIFMELCPICAPPINKIRPLLDTGYVFPILISKYSTYPNVFVKEIIKYPHVTNLEYFTTRDLVLREKIEKFICLHCTKEKFSKIEIIGLNAKEEGSLRKKIDAIINRLSPFSSSEEEFLINLELLLKKKDFNKINTLLEISDVVFNIRTAEAFASPLYITNNINVGDAIDKYIPMQLNQLLQFPEDIILKGLDLEAPADINITKYIEIIMNNRDAIKGIAKHIISQASKNENINSLDISNLLNEIVKLNEEVRRLQKSKKYKILKIGTDILSANKGLISTLICAVALGFQGNLIGCAVSTSAGILGKILKDDQNVKNIIKKFNIKGPTQELKELILNSLEPSLQKMLSIYFSTELKVIQAMRIKDKIKKT